MKKAGKIQLFTGFNSQIFKVELTFIFRLPFF